jgi:hypothetical protein
MNTQKQRQAEQHIGDSNCSALDTKSIPAAKFRHQVCGM